MPLPTSRNTTYNDATPVRNVDLNAIQDCIVGTKHGDRVLCINGCAGVFDAGWAYAYPPARVNSTGAGVIFFAIPLVVGDRIKSVAISRNGDGAVDVVDMIVTKRNDATSSGLGSSGAISNVAAAWATTTIDVTDTTLASGDSIVLQIEVNAAAFTISTVSVTYDHP